MGCFGCLELTCYFQGRIREVTPYHGSQWQNWSTCSLPLQEVHCCGSWSANQHPGDKERQQLGPLQKHCRPQSLEHSQSHLLRRNLPKTLLCWRTRSSRGGDPRRGHDPNKSESFRDIPPPKKSWQHRCSKNKLKTCNTGNRRCRFLPNNKNIVEHRVLSKGGGQR